MKLAEALNNIRLGRRRALSYKKLEASVRNGNNLASAVLAFESLLGRYKKIEKNVALKQIERFVNSDDMTRRWDAFYEVLGKNYFHGTGVKKNFIKSRSFFLKGAETGRSECMFYSADFFFEGVGGKKDFKNSLSWYLKASKKISDGFIFLRLGYQYMYGLGVEESKANAFKYYLKGAKLNDLDATYNLILLSYDMGKVTEETRRYCRKLVSLNYKKKKILQKLDSVVSQKA